MRRRREGRLVAGVAGGLADHLGLDPVYVRVAFAVLTGFGFFGPILYAGYWIAVPQEGSPDRDAPAGLAAAARRGLRLLPDGDRGEPVGQLFALLSVALGLVLLLAQTGLGVPGAVLWPALAVAAGLGVLWRQADEAELARGRAGADGAAGAGRSRRLLAVARFAGGALLVALGLASFVFFSGGAAAGRGLLAGAVVVGGAALIAGPWLLRVWRSLAEERAGRIRSQAHADLAAHLHDSVLQTLALIQRQAGDPREVVRLARSQERDLRVFLYGDPGAAGTTGSDGAEADGATLAVGLRRVAAQVEEAHRVPVEVVTVGDMPLDGAGRALLAAAREAMVNAARHSGAPVVDVYAEVDGAAVTAYVRDRGRGFDPDAVPEDRAGIRHSITGRLARAGGRAVLRARPGEGTEVELRVGG